MVFVTKRVWSKGGMMEYWQRKNQTTRRKTCRYANWSNKIQYLLAWDRNQFSSLRGQGQVLHVG